MGTSTPAPRKWYVWGDSHKHCEVVGKADLTVLVEDIVSAHKVAMAGYEAIPLFGVAWHPCHLYYLANTNNKVVVWLDWDQRGSIMRKALGLQMLIGKHVTTVVTDKDPKSLTFKEIHENLENVLSTT